MILDTSKYLGPCPCGRDHELRTKLVVCEHGALKAITHVRADQEIVLEAQGLHSEKGLIEDCMTRFVRKPDYVVVVGGGTLMDFGRYSAWKLGIPFVAIPTIVSSDGFTADICSIIIDGQKKSIPMQAADAVVCDIDVVAGAPMFLTIAGVQDIMAKVISIADWKIAHLVSGECLRHGPGGTGPDDEVRL